MINIPGRPVVHLPPSGTYSCSFIHIIDKVISSHTLTKHGSLLMHEDSGTFIQDLTLEEFNDSNKLAIHNGHYPLCLMN